MSYTRSKSIEDGCDSDSVYSFSLLKKPGKEQRCPHLTCNAWIDNAEITKGNRGEPVRISNKMFPQPGLYSDRDKQKNTNNICNISNFHLSNISLMSLSKRPLHCPHKDCNRTIAVSSLDSHFRYEHKYVAFIDTHLEARNGLEFFVDDVKLNEILCVVIINIMDKAEVHPILSRTICEKSSNLVPTRPVLVVMATRLELSQHEKPFEKIDDTANMCDCLCQPPSERIFVWIASNIVTKFSYTLAVSTQCNGIRVKYYGPLLTLNENYRSLSAEGKGLILSENQLSGMSGNGTKPLILDILIHSTEEASCTS
ncbi:hypothetical protein MML48_3g00009141 [Holotrichia oblita]|uniref:Uncharacterized protein n=1 Tax=Holotrichia oblita TaxID=644536 RepID=A0ACB9TC19_HOLOL|nr:hypothetical protein MML48_3g00009141 [Holotrichia oblita]